MVISLNQESEVICKAAIDKDLIRASCQHVSRWPKNGGRQKILEKMVCCLDLGFPYLHRICPFWPSQPSSNVWGVCERRICSDEPQRAGTSCCYCTINLWCHPTHLLLSVKFSVRWIFATKTPPTLTSFCNRWQFLSSVYVERSSDRTAAAFSQTKKWSCEQITPISASQAWLCRAPDYSASNFQLVLPRSLFTVSPRWWTPPPPPTPVWPFLLLCDWLEWTEDEAEKVPTKIPAPRSHLLRWSTSHGQSSSKVPILILSQSINRAGGAFPNISGPAQNCLPSQIHHSFQNILENYLLFLEMSLQGYLVVFRRNLFSAVNRTLTTCVCQPADLDLARLSLMVQGHIKNEIDKAQENCTSLNWSHILFKP